MPTQRIIVLTLFLSSVWFGIGERRSMAASGPFGKERVEYGNLPMSDAQLRLSVRKADLVAHGKIIAYQPPTVQNHVGSLETTTVEIKEVYAGTVRPGAVLSYSCVCYREEPPAAAEMIGHEVLVFLTYDKGHNCWSPVNGINTLFYHRDLQDRLKRMLSKPR